MQTATTQAATMQTAITQPADADPANKDAVAARNIRSLLARSATNPPDAAAIERLIEAFGDRDPLIREAAIRRLTPYPDKAAVSVAQAFIAGELATRLTAMEVLERWQAPLASLDPWRSAEFTPERLQALKDWADQDHPSVATRPAKLDEAHLTSARDEIRSLLQADSPLRAAAVRERLVRYGLALLPEVHRQLQATPDDRTTERLTALRHRLVASDSLALRWPGGFDRLASFDVSTRQQAADELARQATPDDAQLLLEMFANPDALVREISLRALQSLDSTEAAEAMTRLLYDPEPNVRAAVLKQLAEKPSRKMVDAVIAYVGTETDADLIVHAVRVLREAKGDKAIECLADLLNHPSWRVRAESAEAIGKAVRELDEEKRADIYAALIKLLSDSDAFVVSRAVTALEGADLIAAIEPLANAIAIHPELAPEIIPLMARGQRMRLRSLAHLRELCHHTEEIVRAAAIGGLCLTEDDVQAELLACLDDTGASVRIAAARGLLRMLERKRPSTELTHLSQVFVSEVQESDSDSSLSHPAWLDQTLPALNRMLGSTDADERVAAALPLVALGHDGPAVPTLLFEARQNPVLQPTVAQALPWLPWDRRLALFHQIMELDPSEEALASLAEAMIVIPDARSAEPLWMLLGRPETNLATVSVLTSSLMKLYGGESHYSPSRIPAARRRRLSTDAMPRAQAGPPLQRAAALALLLLGSPDDAAVVAREVMDDPATPADLRTDAFHILLVSQSNAAGAKSAIEGLASESPEIRRLALTYLTLGGASLRMLRGRIMLGYDFDSSELAYTGGQIITPIAPKGLDGEMLKPLLRDSDPMTAAYAGYLLALLGDNEGLAPLVSYWRQQAMSDQAHTRLVYRAIAAAKTDDRVPVLEEIYGRMEPEDYRTRDFYWTIRSMDGPNGLKLRERIRREVDIQHLR